MPRTVIGAGESESVLVAANSVVHKRDGHCYLFPSHTRSPSLPIRSPLSRSPSPSLSYPYGQPIAAGKQKRARSRPIASDVPACFVAPCCVLSGTRVYIKAAGLSAIRPHTPNPPPERRDFAHFAQCPSSASFSCRTSRAPPLELLFLPYAYARKTRPSDTTLCY